MKYFKVQFRRYFLFKSPAPSSELSSNYLYWNGSNYLSGPQNTTGPVPQQTVASVPSSTGSAYALTSQEANSFYYENSAASGTFQRAFVSQQGASFVAQSQAPTQQIVRPPITVNNQQFQGKAEIYFYEKPLRL